jgi:hypothetical protein
MLLQRGCFRLARSDCPFAKYFFFPREWPSPSSLYLMKFIVLVFPRKDFLHSVVTPSLLLVCNSLSYCFLENESHLSTALFLCALVYHYVSPSKRFAAEPLVFMNSVLSLLLKPLSFWQQRKEKEWEIPVGAMSMKLRTSLNDVFASKKGEKASSSAEKPSSFLRFIFTLIRKFSLLYSHLDCYSAIFAGTHLLTVFFAVTSPFTR